MNIAGGGRQREAIRETPAKEHFMRSVTVAFIALVAVVVTGGCSKKSAAPEPLVLQGRLQVVMEMVNMSFFVSRPYLRADDGNVYYLWVRPSTTEIINDGAAPSHNAVFLPHGFTADLEATYRVTGQVLPVLLGKYAIEGQECTKEEFAKYRNMWSAAVFTATTDQQRDEAEQRYQEFRAQELASELPVTSADGKPVSFLRVDRLERL